MLSEKSAKDCDFEMKARTNPCARLFPALERIERPISALQFACISICLSGCGGITLNKFTQDPSNSVPLRSLTCNQAHFTGAGNITCTVVLDAPAPSAGVILGLSSSSATVEVPADVTIPSNASSASFTANIAAVSSALDVTLTATIDGTSSSFILQLNPSGAILTVSSSSISFGNVPLNTAATQSITLTSSGNAALTISAVTLTGTGFTASGLSFPLTLNPGQTATLNVQFLPNVASALSGQLSVKSNSVTNPTTLISLSGVGAVLSYEVSLTWDAPSGSGDPVAGYSIYRVVSGSSTYQLLNSRVNTSTSFADSNVQSGSTYQYYVTSVDSSGVESDPSNVASVSIP
jgi:hypothetical protein